MSDEGIALVPKTPGQGSLDVPSLLVLSARPRFSFVEATTATLDERCGTTELTGGTLRQEMICCLDTALCPTGREPRGPSRGGQPARSPSSWRICPSYKTSSLPLVCSPVLHSLSSPFSSPLLSFSLSRIDFRPPPSLHSSLQGQSISHTLNPASMLMFPADHPLRQSPLQENPLRGYTVHRLFDKHIF